MDKNDINREDKEKKNEKFFITSILILIALLIIIFLLVRYFGYIEHRPRIPTGNVDIFDINFNVNCNNNCECNNNNDNNDNNGNSGDKKPTTNTTTNNGSSSGNTENPSESSKPEEKPSEEQKPEENPSTPVEDEKGVQVFDEDTKYSMETPLNIFTKTAYYVVDDKIAPASENSYQFVIRNNNPFNIKYSLDFIATNKHNINMKYRLKLNNNYVVGNDDVWVTYDELMQYDMVLSNYNYDVYTLDWKWFESSNDTSIGTNINSNYKLEIKVTATEI